MKCSICKGKLQYSILTSNPGYEQWVCPKCRLVKQKAIKENSTIINMKEKGELK